MKQIVIVPKHPDAERAARRWEELRSDRTRHEELWKDLARLIRPQRGGFGLDDPSARDFDKPLSSAPIMAQGNFAAGLYGTLHNPANRWMGLKTSDPDLNRYQPVREWLDMTAEIILASFGPAVSTFYDAAIMTHADVATFGNAAHYDELRSQERRILDMTLSLSEVVWDVDAYGRVWEVVRRFRLRAPQAVDQFGQALPDSILAAAEKGQSDKFVFYHHVYRNIDVKSGDPGPKGKAWISVHAAEDGMTLLRRGGYAEMPFFCPRWEVDAGQVYGVGPGFVALPSARVNQQMEAANLRAGQRASDPTLLAPDRETFPLSGRVAPGSIIYNGVSPNGQPMLHALDTTRGTGLTLEMQARKVDEIRDAFLFSLMNLAGRTGMTATEIMERTEERLRLMAPNLGRLQTEFLAPKISRRFAMLWRAGQIPPPPPETNGVSLEPEYLSAAAMAQKAAEGTAIMRLVQDLGPLAGVKPRLIDRISDDDLVELLAEARGVPARVLMTREQADAQAQARAEAEAQAQQMQMMREGAGAARDLAGAEAALAGAREGGP